MPASPSRPPSTKPRQAAAPPAPPARKRVWLWILLGVLVIAAVAASALPASLIARALPPGTTAEDFSGTLWHGSAGRITADRKDLGALEWRLHPVALLHAAVAADIHWVKTSFVVDGSVEASRGGFSAHDLHGGGPVEDLAVFGLPPGWSGIAAIDLRAVSGTFTAAGADLTALVGDVEVRNLASIAFTDGADIGGYKLHMANGAITPDAEATAELTDLGGPLEVSATIHYTPREKRAMLSGTLRERGKLPPSLQAQLQNLAQLRPRDAQGRLPVDFEFTL